MPENVNPPEHIWDGVFIPYLENLSVCGNWKSVRQDRARKEEVGAGQDFFSRSAVNRELGQSLLSPTFLSFSPSSSPPGVGNERGYMCQGMFWKVTPTLQGCR